MKIRYLMLLLPLSFAAAVAIGQQVELTGSLFTSPQQREYLDYLRKDYLSKNRKAVFDIKDSEIPAIPDEKTPSVNNTAAPPQPVELTFKGSLKRSDGSYVLWLNEKQYKDSELPRNMHLATEGAIPFLRIRLDTGKTIELRPGQTYVQNGDLFQERYQRPSPVTATAAKTDSNQFKGTDIKSKLESISSPEKPPALSAASNTSPVPNESQKPDADNADLINDLPDGVRNNASKLESMIQQLRNIRGELEDKKKQ